MDGIYFILPRFEYTYDLFKFFGSFTLGLISHYMARKKREPAIIFMVTGIIPLVPGGLAFDATKNLVLLQFGKAINTMLEVTLIAGAIALDYYSQTKFQKSSFLVSLDDVNVYNNKTRELVINPHLSRLRILFLSCIISLTSRSD